MVVDSFVAVEALVLNGHDGLLHDLGDLAGGDDDAALVALQHGEQAGVRGAVVDVGVVAPGARLLLVELRHVAGDGGDHRVREHDDGDGGDRGGEHGEVRAEGARLAVSRRSLRRRADIALLYRHDARVC